MMRGNRWLFLLALLVAGGVIGAGGIIVSLEVNRATSTDAFCASCHSMATLAADPHYRQSRHEANAAGFQVSCSDCHIPSGNWFVETYTHVAFGLRDVVAEYSHDFNDPELWQKRRTELAEQVRAEMRRDGSITCRKCHDAVAIRPATEAGRAAHAMLAQGQVTCIDCHINLVHAPAAGTLPADRR
jgi:nitrate/TMAO reductase-like tetraheme cytochrome c subunit